MDKPDSNKKAAPNPRGYGAAIIEFTRLLDTMSIFD
jgi:hypothetical protein